MDLVVEALQAGHPGVKFDIVYSALNEKERHETNTNGSTNQRELFAAAAKIGLLVPPGKKFYSSPPTKSPLAHLHKQPNSKTAIPESVVQMGWHNAIWKLFASLRLAEQIQVQMAATSNVTLPCLNRKRPDFCAISEDGRHLVSIKSGVAFLNLLRSSSTQHLH